MEQSGKADLALMGGAIPPWLFERMCRLSLPVVEAILEQKGHKDFLERLSNPFWFQSFAAVIGMDWNSSGATTAVMSALKQSINPASHELGLYICGGKGKESLKTPQELVRIGDFTGLDGNALARSSKLVAKVDNTAVQDGFNLYLHSFILSKDGDWTAIQQGMKTKERKARRYHWHSGNFKSFIEEPHTAICGLQEGKIVNLVDKEASKAQANILGMTEEHPDRIMKELPHLLVPSYHDVRPKDVDVKRLGSILWKAQEADAGSFEDLLLLKGMGPRTLQSLALVSEMIHGAPSRFSDPARFSFAHGAKNAKPFPVPTKVYDETIDTMRDAVNKSKLGQSDKLKSLEKLSKFAERAEKAYRPSKDAFDRIVENENKNSHKYGGRVKERKERPRDSQLNLFGKG